ncbi:MAG: ATP phosphoribosyltransferase [Hyphomicrobiaceae bacterium]|nr:ATP phosphoribosyltransferase [Hyphomicrobiaceae bacterium]
MSGDPLILALPSKGRLMERAGELFEASGLPVRKTGHERGYRGEIDGYGGVEIAFLSATEIAYQLGLGRIHLGITGEDLIRESGRDGVSRTEIVRPLGFGKADVVVAVPECWLDVSRMGDLEDVAATFFREHGRRLRVATKYMNLTRRFFSDKGVTGYRLVESLGATEGTVAAGTAEIIVDITSTGTTLKANHLKVLSDGLILESQAVLAKSTAVDWPSHISEALTGILSRLDTNGA